MKNAADVSAAVTTQEQSTNIVITIAVTIGSLGFKFSYPSNEMRSPTVSFNDQILNKDDTTQRAQSKAHPLYTHKNEFPS
jgi:hypothetical protein